jgi:hypothetical protein
MSGTFQNKFVKATNVGSVMIQGLYGNEFNAIWEGQMYACEISLNTHAKLLSTKYAYWEVFREVETAELPG